MGDLNCITEHLISPSGGTQSSAESAAPGNVGIELLQEKILLEVIHTRYTVVYRVLYMGADSHYRYGFTIF